MERVPGVCGDGTRAAVGLGGEIALAVVGVRFLGIRKEPVGGVVTLAGLHLIARAVVAEGFAGIRGACRRENADQTIGVVVPVGSGARRVGLGGYSAGSVVAIGQGVDDAARLRARTRRELPCRGIGVGVGNAVRPGQRYQLAEPWLSA